MIRLRLDRRVYRAFTSTRIALKRPRGKCSSSYAAPRTAGLSLLPRCGAAGLQGRGCLAGGFELLLFGRVLLLDRLPGGVAVWAALGASVNCGYALRRRDR